MPLFGHTRDSGHDPRYWSHEKLDWFLGEDKDGKYEIDVLPDGFLRIRDNNPDDPDDYSGPTVWEFKSTVHPEKGWVETKRRPSWWTAH